MGDFPVSAGDRFRGTTINSHDVNLGIGRYLLGINGETPYGSAVYPTANKAVLVPFIAPHPITIVKVFWNNGTAVAGNVDVGIYDLNGNRLVSTGSTAQAGTTVMQSVDTTDVQLSGGRYFMALAASSGTAQFLRWNQVAGLFGAAGVLEAATSFPLPDPIVPAAMTMAYLPSFGITARTII